MVKKAQGLPINIVVMLIIGILIFGLGLSLFSKMFTAGEDQVGDLSSEIRDDLQGLACKGGEWLCASDVKLRAGEDVSASILITNMGTTAEDFRLEFEGTSTTPIDKEKTGCGKIRLYPFTGDHTIQAGKTSSIPVKIFSQNFVKDCTYIVSVELECTSSCEGDGEKTALLVRVED